MKVENLDFAALEQNAERASDLLKTIGSKWRLLVVCQLLAGEKTVSELELITGLNQSALSQHLMVLRHRELVITRRVAQNIYYSLNSTVVTDLLVTLHKHYCGQPGAGASDTRPSASKKAPRQPKTGKANRQQIAQRARSTQQAKRSAKAARH